MKHIDKAFRDTLYNHEIPVPDGMWEKIAPAIEDNSGRGVLWMWFAGLLALILGGLLAFGVFTTDSESPLAANKVTDTPAKVEMGKNVQSPSNVNEITLAAADQVEVQVESTPVSIVAEQSPTVNPLSKKSKSTTVDQETSLENTQEVAKLSPVAKKVDTVVKVEATIAEGTNVTLGTPANLVITKSYINGTGSIVEQSKLSEEEQDKPVYNVFINSEGLNAGALLRIIEPLQNIPLPAFEKTVKKKITVNL